MSVDFKKLEDQWYDFLDNEDNSEKNTISNFCQFREKVNGELIKEILHNGLHNESKLLSIGIGPGNKDTELLLNNCNHIFGFDISPKALRVCKQRYPQTILINGSGDALPFKDNIFDFTCFNAVVHHMTGQSLNGKRRKLIHYALDEAYRVLRPGGCIFCLEPNMLYPSTLAIYPINSIMQKIKPGWRGLVPTERNIPPQKLRWLLQSHGFSEIEYHATTFANEKLPSRIFQWMRDREDKFRYNKVLKNFGVWTIITARKSYP
jgi:ubiquinone/menaquinone biosynthesis C-methylase UbiE